MAALPYAPVRFFPRPRGAQAGDGGKLRREDGHFLKNPVWVFVKMCLVDPPVSAGGGFGKDGTLRTLLFRTEPRSAERVPEGQDETLSSPFSTSGMEREEKT